VVVWLSRIVVTLILRKKDGHALQENMADGMPLFRTEPERQIRLDSLYVYRAGAFASFTNLEFNGLAIPQVFALDFRMMDEQIVAVFALDESVAFILVEPLHFSFRHV